MIPGEIFNGNKGGSRIVATGLAVFAAGQAMQDMQPIRNADPSIVDPQIEYDEHLMEQLFLTNPVAFRTIPFYRESRNRGVVLNSDNTERIVLNPAYLDHLSGGPNHVESIRSTVNTLYLITDGLNNTFDSTTEWGRITDGEILEEEVVRALLVINPTRVHSAFERIESQMADSGLSEGNRQGLKTVLDRIEGKYSEVITEEAFHQIEASYQHIDIYLPVSEVHAGNFMQGIATMPPDLFYAHYLRLLDFSKTPEGQEKLGPHISHILDEHFQKYQQNNGPFSENEYYLQAYPEDLPVIDLSINREIEYERMLAYFAQVLRLTPETVNMIRSSDYNIITFDEYTRVEDVRAAGRFNAQERAIVVNDFNQDPEVVTASKSVLIHEIGHAIRGARADMPVQRFYPDGIQMTYNESFLFDIIYIGSIDKQQFVNQFGKEYLEFYEIVKQIVWGGEDRLNGQLAYQQLFERAGYRREDFTDLSKDEIALLTRSMSENLKQISFTNGEGNLDPRDEAYATLGQRVSEGILGLKEDLAVPDQYKLYVDWVLDKSDTAERPPRGDHNLLYMSLLVAALLWSRSDVRKKQRRM